MSFRQAKNDEQRRKRLWEEWITRQRSALQALGLPAEVYLSEKHWEDFLENGHLERHPQDSTGFEFGQISPAAAGALRRFLEQQ